MPRSIDPRNYGPFYDKIAELMDKGEQEITLTMPGRLAIYHRNNFYAYVNAWKHKAKSIPTDKTIPNDRREHLLEQALRREDVLRKYLVVVDPDPVANKDHMDKADCKLRFVLRGMDKRQVEGIEQLNVLLAKSKGIDFDEFKELLQPTGELKPIDPSSLRDRDSPVAHLFSGITTKPDPDMTEEMADEILRGVPTDRTDLTDLITESNQGESKAPNYMEEALKGAEKLREKEKEK